MFSAEVQQSAKALRAKGHTQRHIAKTLGVSRRTVQGWPLEAITRSISCSICGKSFVWRVTASNVREYCYSKSCKRAKRRQRSRSYNKTEKGREGLRRRGRRHWKKKAERMPLRACKICGAEIERGSTLLTCGETCRKEATERQRQRTNQAAVEYYNENKDEMRARSRVRAKEDYEADPEYYRWKRRHIKLKDPDKYRDWNWRYGVRKALGCEPTEEMWALLEARRELHRELGWTQLGKRWVAHDDNLYGPGGAIKRKG